MQKYLDEFSFRLGENGNVTKHVYDRIESIIDSSFDKQLSYKDLIS